MTRDYLDMLADPEIPKGIAIGSIALAVANEGGHNMPQRIAEATVYVDGMRDRNVLDGTVNEHSTYNALLA